jgi:hypothetical protein
VPHHLHKHLNVTIEIISALEGYLFPKDDMDGVIGQAHRATWYYFSSGS